MYCSTMPAANWGLNMACGAKYSGWLASQRWPSKVSDDAANS